MLFSFWHQLWVKRAIAGAYCLLVIFGSITFCYWTLKADTDVEIVSNKPIKIQIQTSCHSEIERARLAFEKNQTLENWKVWADLELGCKS